mgnify:CR=1 FL=1
MFLGQYFLVYEIGWLRSVVYIYRSHVVDHVFWRICEGL